MTSFRQAIPQRLRPSVRTRRVLIPVLGVVVGAAILVAVIARRRDEFATALDRASVLVLIATTLLQLVALVARTEAWHVCVRAAGGTIARRPLFRAASVGYLGSQLNSQLGAAARIAALRRAAPATCPRVPALIAAEVPILLVEGALAALASFTLVVPLGLPWWVPLICLAVAVAIGHGLRRLSRRERGMWRGLAVLGCLRGRRRVVGLVLIAVMAQIFRNWMMLHAVGLHVSLLDSVAVLIAMVILSQLPIGPSVGAGATALIVGSHGVGAAAAAGVLLTATGTAGALCYVAGAALDRLRPTRPTPPRSLPVGPRPAAAVAAAASRSYR